MSVEPPLDDPPVARRTLPRLIAAGVLDAPLAALGWILLDGRVPLLVAGGGRNPRDASVEPAVGDADPRDGGSGDPPVEIVRAFEPFVPPSAGRATPGVTGVDGDPAADILVAGLLRGGDLRRAVRAVSRGFGLLAAVDGASLEDLLHRLGDLAIGATDAAIGRLGVVLVAGGQPTRILAAHYLRPVVRDAGGHLRSLAPAVLATWDARAGRHDHFAWGIYPELAERLGLRAGDLERDHEIRTDWLAQLAASDDGADADAVAHAVAVHRPPAVGPGAAAHSAGT